MYDIYQVYLEKMNSDPRGPFYRRPLDGPGLRFSIQPVGVNKLSVLIKSCCAAAGLKGQFSNHSGKRTCATSLFQRGVDEQLIMSRTGHRSTAVRAYKRPCPAQAVEVSKILDPPKSKVKIETVTEPTPIDMPAVMPSADRPIYERQGQVFNNCHVSFNFGSTA